MDHDTIRSYDGLEPAETYWRRRAYVLIAALVTVGLLAWSCSASDDEKKGRIGTAAALIGATPSLGPVASGTPSPSATSSKTPGPSARKKDDTCAESDVVINLLPVKDAYRGREQPTFEMSVVNTGQQSCTFDVGPKSLEVRIQSGSDRVWSSAFCVSGAATRTQTLRRGIPYMATADWDRRRSAAGCKGSRSRAARGTYVVRARAGKLKTKTQVFHLR